MTGWIMWALSSLFRNLGVIAEGMETIAQPIDLLDAPDAQPLKLTQGEIRLHEVSHHYGRGAGGLDRVSLTIRPGEKVLGAELVEAFAERDDLRYITDIGPDEGVAKALQDKYADRFFMTPKKMGAQTSEANINAGLAAANQIVGFFERGEKNFIVNG